MGIQLGGNEKGGLIVRVLIIHHECQFFGGAERMLLYLVSSFVERKVDFAVATVEGSRLCKALPPGTRVVGIPANPAFSLSQLWIQARGLTRFRREYEFDVVHGWAARGWELATLAGMLSRRPAVGTLHDHPEAIYIRLKRRRLMRWNARWGLRKVICVSEAVRRACLKGGYPGEKLDVIHNGISNGAALIREQPGKVLRFGYLGVFSEGKGLEGVFEMVEELARVSAVPWEMWIAGGAQSEEGCGLVEAIREKYKDREWWPRVSWRGWADDPVRFLSQLDLLIFPSRMFDSFPNVLLEAGLSGTPVLAARVGGVAEIIREGETGWLFEPGNWREGGGKLGEIVANKGWLAAAGERSKVRIREVFPMEKMVAKYLELYSSLEAHV